jgi:protein SCO1/2
MPPVETPRRSLTRAVIPAIAAAALAALAALLLASRNSGDNAATAVNQNCILEGADAVGGPIELVDTSGATLTEADFAGQPAVLYFGFTHCPDICPTSMYLLGEALQLQGAPDVQTILVSVDPERDTPQRMGEYVRTEGFPEGLVGLTGSTAQVDAAKRAFHVYAGRAPIPNAPDDVYTVDHSSMFYIVDGQWRTRSILRTAGATPEQLAQCISAGLERR